MVARSIAATIPVIRRLFFMWGFDFLLRVAVLAEEVDLYGSEVRARTGRSLRDHESDEVAAYAVLAAGCVRALLVQCSVVVVAVERVARHVEHGEPEDGVRTVPITSV